MTKAAIQLELSGGEPVGEALRFDPGSRVEGRVQVTAAEEIKCRRVVVRAGWHTADHGNPESGQAIEQPLADGPLAANSVLAHSFALELPHAPWSFSGTVVRIEWEVRVVIDLPLTADINQVQPIIVAPRGQGPTRPGEPGA